MADVQGTLFQVQRKVAQVRHHGKSAPRPPVGPVPLKTRECANYIGQGLDFIYGLIADGDLKAEYLLKPGKTRGTWVVPQDEWIRCLKKLKWSRIPKIV